MSDAAAAMATTQGLERVLNIRDSPASLNPTIALPKACRYETHQPRRRDPERRDNVNTWLAGAYLIIKRISPAILIKEMPMSWFYS